MSLICTCMCVCGIADGTFLCANCIELDTNLTDGREQGVGVCVGVEGGGLEE